MFIENVRKSARPWETTGEAELLRKSVASVKSTAKWFVEIGSQLGNSTVILGKAMKGSGRLLWAVDTFCGPPGARDETWTNLAAKEIATAFIANLCDAGLWNTLRILKCSSEEAYAIVNPTPLALVFLDGDHSSPGVDFDFACWPLLVDEGGVIIVHDTDKPDVAKALAAWKATWRAGEWEPVGEVSILSAWRKCKV